jgi:serine-type D-Ala-D-Ala carboxypeptidase/endopeptidase
MPLLPSGLVRSGLVRSGPWHSRPFRAGLLHSGRFRPVLVLLCSLIVPTPVEAQHFPADEDLELMLRFIVEDHGTPGIVLGVLEADGTARVVSYGSGGAGSAPLGPRSVFEIGSVTKTFTATLLADMVLKGEVALEDPVSRYLPDHVTVPSYEGREITLLDLATHTSALPGGLVDVNWIRSRIPFRHGDTFTDEDAYTFLSGFRLTREPGVRHSYSNFGYALLGHALGRAAGADFRELVRSRILDPLGMESTGFTVEGELEAWMTQGHQRLRTVRQRTDEIEFFDGSGGLRSSAEDLLKYMRAQVGSPETEETDLEAAMRMAREIRVPTASDGSGHGLAWSTSAGPAGEPIVAHSGGTPGFSTRFLFMPQARIGTVLLVNQRPFTDGLAAGLLLPGPPPPDWSEVAVEGELLARYAGAYALPGQPPRYFLRVEEGGYLSYQPEGRARARLYATSDTTFYLLRGPWTFTFRADDELQVVELAMEVDVRASGTTERQVARKVGDDTPSSAVAAGQPATRGRGSWAWFGLFGAVLVLALPLWLRSRRGVGRAIRSDRRTGAVNLRRRRPQR